MRWHPSKEHLLAFGTEEGQVGLYDLERDRSVLLASSHRRIVYGLAWVRVQPSIGRLLARPTSAGYGTLADEAGEEKGGGEGGRVSP